MKRALRRLFGKVFGKNAAAKEGVKWRTPARRYAVGGGWGNSIEIRKKDEYKVGKMEIVGWKSVRPTEGDVLVMRMESGRNTAWVIYDVDLIKDPWDMFFAKVALVGYEDEVEMPEEEKIASVGFHLL